MPEKSKKSLPVKVFLIFAFLIAASIAAIVYVKTTGIPKALYKSDNIDSIQVVYKNKIISITDNHEVEKFSSALSESQKAKADRTNINKNLIEIRFYKKSGSPDFLYIIENAFHGYLLVSGWIYYRNDHLSLLVKEYTKTIE